MTKVAFLGAGSMGGAIARGLLASGFPAEDIRATTRGESSAAGLREELGIGAAARDTDPAANREAAGWADVVILGVKPGMVRETLVDLGDSLGADTVLASVAAGISLATLGSLAGAAVPVRLMPNTPVQIGEGVISVTAAADDPGLAAVATLRGLLSPVARLVEIDEDQIPAMIGISGSGTAYFFYLSQALVAAGEDLGLTNEQAREIVEGTARGAGLLLSETREDPAVLRKNITSPGGTTAAALAEFEAGRVDAVIRAAARAAAARNLEMERSQD